MSYNKQSISPKVRFRKAAKYSLTFDLQAEGLQMQDGILNKVNASQVDLGDRAEIEEMSPNQFEGFLKPLTKNARFLAHRVRECPERSDRELLGELAAYRDARQWIKAQDGEMQDFLKSQEIGAKTLVVDFGLRWIGEFSRFIAIYREVCDLDRNWRSIHQPAISSVYILATTPEYGKLPLWVKASLLKSTHGISKDRIGNIWRLIPCAKAWKWQRELPKKIAERVGKMPVAKRVIARQAWFAMLDESRNASRLEKEKTFWLNFNKLSQNPLLVLEEIVNEAEKVLKNPC